MAYGKSDFVLFKDIDLDFFLGEFTASEYENSEDEDKISVKSKEDKRKTYVCDQCDKSYNSVSGIRGHLRNKHGVKNVKASAYRLDAENRKTKVNSFTMDEEHFSKVFTEIFHSSLKNVCNNRFRNLKSSVYGKGIVSIGSSLKENTYVQQLLIKALDPLYYKVLSSSADSDNNVNEVLLSKYYELFHDESLISNLIQILESLQISNVPLKQFVATLNRQLIQDLIHKRTEVYEKAIIQDKEIVLSQTEQSVLFYISGFMIKKIVTNKQLEKNLDDEMIAKLVKNDKDSEKTFVNKFSEWTEQVNRGGLKVPSDNFFLFIRSCELIVRKNIDEEHVTSHIYTTIKEIILEDHMVKHYSEQLFQGNQAPFLIEFCVDLFLKVRGHAAAKVLKEKLQKSDESTKSMRHVLKDKSNIN